MEKNNPFKECETCKTLADCKHVNVAQDMMGTPMPPDNCPKPIEVIRQTLKLKKQKRNG